LFWIYRVLSRRFAADAFDGEGRFASAAAASLPGHWREAAAPAALARLGDDFAPRAHAGLLLVPSALAPRERNGPVNPARPDFARVEIQPLEPFAFDARLSRPRR
jgi:RES domain-containing protein